MDNHMGKISISDAYFASLVTQVASECFGVVGLANSSPAQGLRSLFSKKEIPDKGVRIRSSGGELVIDLHIVVSYGVNVAVIIKSIANKVSYSVQAASGLTVSKVNIYVAEMKTQ